MSSTIIRKINRNFQITLPPSFIKINNLQEGDLVEIFLNQEEFTTKVFNKKNSSINSLLKTLDQPVSKTFNQMSEQEVINTVNTEIKLKRKK